MADYPENGIKYAEKNIQGVIVAETPASIGVVVRGKCKIGFMSYTGSGSIYNTNIGRFCSIASGLTSGPTNHPTDRFSTHLFAFANYGTFKGSPEFEEWVRQPGLSENTQRVQIGNDVWIGRDVIIKRGITIGDGAIVGAGSVVTKDVAPYAIVGGIPAKFIRNRFSDEIIERLQKLQWHSYRIDRDSVPELDVTDIEKTLAILEQAQDSGVLKKLVPKKFRIGAADITAL
jgi:acetyltransferase-like isoleucine patch superfamily enzyme